jgi:hypothetical protein
VRLQTDIPPKVGRIEAHIYLGWRNFGASLAVMAGGAKNRWHRVLLSGSLPPLQILCGGKMLSKVALALAGQRIDNWDNSSTRR